MFLQSLRIHSFRNLHVPEIQFGPGLNVFFGRNGQGKTNLLESIYVLGLTKSFRTSRLSECLQHGQTGFALYARVESGTLQRELAFSWNETGKELRLNGKSAGLMEYLGSLDALVVSFDQLPVVHGAPEERRRFLDRSIAISDKGYVRLLAEFRHVLRQRNLLLGRVREGSARVGELDAWEELYRDRSGAVTVKRRGHVSRLNTILDGPGFSSDRLRLDYRPSLPEGAEAQARALTEARNRDLQTGRSHRGPHRDELKILLDGREIQKVGSGGQQRSAIFTLLFASQDIYLADIKELPLIIVDDLDAELDLLRLEGLLDRLAAGGQVFVSSAKESLLKSVVSSRSWEIEAGQARPLGPGAR